MIEKVYLKYLDKVSDVAHVVGIDVSENPGLIGKSNLAKEVLSVASIHNASRAWENPGWHRIVIGAIGGRISAGVISIIQNYGYSNGGGVIFAFMGSGYIIPNISVLCKAGNGFSKIRILRSAIPNNTSLLIDVYYIKENSNNIWCSLANSPGDVTLTDFADTIVDIPEGFNATEFEI